MISPNEVKTLRIVCSEDTMKYGTYLMQLISQRDDTEDNITGPKDGSIDAVLWSEKEYEDNRVKLPARAHVLFVGRSKLIDNEAANMDIVFNKFGMRFYSLGTRAVMRVYDGLSKKEYTDFENFCSEYGKSYSSVLGLDKAAATAGAGIGVLAVLAGPVGWGAVAVAAAAGGVIGGLTSRLHDKKEIKDQQYSFLTLYSYLELLSDFMKD